MEPQNQRLVYGRNLHAPVVMVVEKCADRIKGVDYSWSRVSFFYVGEAKGKGIWILQLELL